MTQVEANQDTRKNMDGTLGVGNPHSRHQEFFRGGRRRLALACGSFLLACTGAGCSVNEPEVQDDPYEANREAVLAQNRQLAAKLREAGELMDEGRCVAALEIYRQLIEEAPAGINIRTALRKRIPNLTMRLETLERGLRSSVPDPVPMFIPESYLEEVLVQLERDFREEDLAVCRRVLEAESDPNFLEMVPDESRTRLVSSARAVVDLFEVAAVREEEYQRGLGAKQVPADLMKVFGQARAYEKQREYDKALDAYRTLVREYPARDGLFQIFKQKVEMYSKILR